MFHALDGKILGAQVVGGPDVQPHINVLATALHGGLHVEELLNLPLMAEPSHPVIQLAQAAQSLMAAPSQKPN